MSFLPYISCGLLGLGVAFLLVPLIIRFCQEKSTGFAPGEMHHTHKTPVPRLGGLALISAFLATAAIVVVCFPSEIKSLRIQGIIAFSSVAMFLVGFADDMRPIGARKKFALQILIAAAVFFMGLRIEVLKDPFTGTVFQLGLWSGPITILWLVGITNLINLIDGADGLAAGICLMLMVLLAVVGTSVQNIGLMAAGMAGALVGFLYYNFPPARIYMGDGGAYFLGFLIAILSISCSHKGTVAAALVAPLFVLALPILDTTIAILRRGLKGLPIFRPDRRHLHHRLSEMGYSRQRVVLTIYGITLVFLIMAFGAFWSQGKLVPVLLGLMALTLLACARKWNFSREWFAVGKVMGNSLEMRRRVQYALSLNRWFELEGERAETLEDLWQDFVYVAKKLRFSSVKLTLEDGERLWEAPGCLSESGDQHQAEFSFQHGKAGILEIRANHCQHEMGPNSRACCEMGCAWTSNENLFHILSELAAEGWHNSARNWQRQTQLPMRYQNEPTQAATPTRKRGKLMSKEPVKVGVGE